MSDEVHPVEDKRLIDPSSPAHVMARMGNSAVPTRIPQSESLLGADKTFGEHIDKLSPKTADVQKKFKGEHQLAEIQRLQKQTEDAGIQATNWTRNWLAGDVGIAEKALPPEMPPLPKPDDVAALLKMQEIRQSLRTMDQLVRSNFVRASTKQGDSTILTAILTDPLRLGGADIIPGDALSAAVDDWRHAVDPDAWKKFEEATLANQIMTSLTNGFRKRVASTGFGIEPPRK